MNSSPVRKAVFPVAGLGTRFLPATKAIPKEMLPIIDRPLIDFAVQEAIAAGIETLIFVTGRHKRAIADHFDRNLELEMALERSGKQDLLETVRSPLPDGVECIYVRQPVPNGLGDAVLRARNIVGNEPFAVLLADEYLPKGLTTRALIDRYMKTGRSQLAVQEIEGPEISNYGVISPGRLPRSVSGLIEKPAFEQAPSKLASLGRYVLSPEIFDLLEELEPGSGGEIQLADAIDQHAKSDTVAFHQIEEKRYDCGSKKGYCDALSDAISTTAQTQSDECNSQDR